VNLHVPFQGLVALFLLLLLSRDGFFSIWHIRAASNLHNQLFEQVLKVRTFVHVR